MDKLYIVIPAYNEEETIEDVAREWHQIVEKIGEDSRLVIINDGSKDSTYEKLLELKMSFLSWNPFPKKTAVMGAPYFGGINMPFLKVRITFSRRTQMGRPFRTNSGPCGKSVLTMISKSAIGNTGRTVSAGYSSLRPSSWFFFLLRSVDYRCQHAVPPDERRHSSGAYR